MGTDEWNELLVDSLTEILFLYLKKGREKTYWLTCHYLPSQKELLRVAASLAEFKFYFVLGFFFLPLFLDGFFFPNSNRSRINHPAFRLG